MSLSASRDDAAPVSSSAAFVLATWLVWGVLTALQLGWIPPLRYAWGYNFWQYLPALASPALAAVGLAVCIPWTRTRAVALVERIAASVRGLPRGAAPAIVFVVLATSFWMVRERQILGDSYLLLTAIHTGTVYVFPELGATFFLSASARLVEPFGLDILTSAPLTSCVFGAATVLLLARAGTVLCGDRAGRGAVLTAIVLSAGLLRLFAGHVEVYPAFLMGASAYLFAAALYLKGRTRLLWPALALGATVWVHMAGVLLAPSLAVLPWLARPSATLSERARDLVQSALVAALPTLVFLVLAYAFGPRADFELLVRKILEVLGQSDAPGATSWWVRFGEDGPTPTLGIDYVFLSFAHLKYLANAYHVLAPAGVVIVVATLVVAPRRLLAPEALLLIVATAPQIVYSLVLRPFWGPFDWDLFSSTGFFLALLGAWLVCTGLSRRDLEHVAAVVVGLQLVYVGGPFVALAAGTPRDAGPFVHGTFSAEVGRPGMPRHEQLAPWF